MKVTGPGQVQGPSKAKKTKSTSLDQRKSKRPNRWKTPTNASELGEFPEDWQGICVSMCQSDSSWFDLLGFCELQKPIDMSKLKTTSASHKLDLIKKFAVKSVLDQ